MSDGGDTGTSASDVAPASTPSEIPQMPDSPVVEPTPPSPEIPQPPETPTPMPETPGTDIPPPAPPTVPEPAQAPQAPVPAQVTIKDRLYLTLPSSVELLKRAREKIQFRKRAKLDKILALAAKKKSIKNDDVEKLLKVSDSTATNYLNELVRKGKLKRVGNARQPTYEPV